VSLGVQLHREICDGLIGYVAYSNMLVLMTPTDLIAWSSRLMDIVGIPGLAFVHRGKFRNAQDLDALGHELFEGTRRDSASSRGVDGIPCQGRT
jgi:hypothetical protein